MLRSTLVCALLAVMSSVFTNGCKKEPGPSCKQLKECCSGVQASTAKYDDTSAPSLCQTYFSAGTTDDDVCFSLLGDVRRATTSASRKTQEPIPKACE